MTDVQDRASRIDGIDAQCVFDAVACDVRKFLLMDA